MAPLTDQELDEMRDDFQRCKGAPRPSDLVHASRHGPKLLAEIDRLKKEVRDMQAFIDLLRGRSYPEQP